MAATEERIDRRPMRTTETSDWVDVLTGPVARWMFGIPFMLFGIVHFAFTDAMAGTVPIPGGAFWVYLTGAALIAAGIAIVTKTAVKWAGILLALMLLGFVAMVHIPAAIEAGTMPSLPATMVLKDTLIAAGALIVAGRWGGP